MANQAVAERRPRPRLLPWFIGFAVIVVIDGLLLLFLGSEGASELAEAAVLIAVPAVYLGLMYLTFISQK